MGYKHIFFISPPFYSHFNPLLVLAKSFKKFGIAVTFGCSCDFKEIVLNADLDFYEIDISKNKNIGKAEQTKQPDSERDRLEEFFESTRKGAVETLITQSRHRQDDMLSNPDELIDKIKKINELLKIDLFVVDVLSYGVTLGLYSLNLPFITFCPPHPNTIPKENDYYGVPKNWPSAIEVKAEKIEELKEISIKTQIEFTEIFNKILSYNQKENVRINNAFSLVSERAIIYNYFDFYNNENIEHMPYQIFMGNCFEEDSLERIWVEKVKSKEKKILITLGTFLSNREDVLEKLIIGCKKYDSKSVLIVSAGNNVEKLKKYRASNIIIEDFVPQRALMPYMDLVIHHGGCNTFTEAMYYGKSMLILPFSSDQFNIAYDSKNMNLAEILDPNKFKEEDLLEALKNTMNQSKDELEYWSEISKKRGSDYVAKILLGF